MNTVDEATVRILVQLIWQWRDRDVGRCIVMVEHSHHCQMIQLFSAIRRRIGLLIRHSRALRPVCPDPNTRFRSYLMNSRKCWLLPFRPISVEIPCDSGAIGL